MLCIVLGLLVAIWVWTTFEKKALGIAIFIMLLILIPPFIHVQSWIYFMDRVIQNFTGEYAIILTIAFSYLPITAGLCLMALLTVPSEIADQCSLEGGGWKTFLRIYLPLILPALIFGGLLVFLLNINDYGIPSVFGVNVFSLQLFSMFSAKGEVSEVYIAAIPLLIVCLIVMGALGSYLSRLNFSFSGFQGKTPFKKDVGLNLLSILGMLVFAAFVFVPLGNLVFEVLAVNDVVSILADSFDEFGYSFFTSALTALICLIPAIFFAYIFLRTKHKGILLAIVSLPFMLPAAIGGISLIVIMNNPLLQEVYRSPVMPTIALVLRFTLVEVLIISYALVNLESGLLDNLRLHNPGLVGTFRCLVALVWRESLAGVLIVFALAMGEFGVTLLVTPPGYQTITVKIYNYLHYGASEIVAVLCLSMLLFMLLFGGLIFMLLRGGKHEG